MSIDHGDRLRARDLLDRIQGERQDAETAFAQWRFLAAGNETEAALEVVKEGAALFSDDPDLQRALGWTLGESGQPQDALAALKRAVELDPDFADAWHDLALAREVVGDLEGMQEAFAEVYALDTDGSLPPPRFPPEQVLSWANHAIGVLPPSVQNVIPKLPIFVQD